MPIVEVIVFRGLTELCAVEYKPSDAEDKNTDIVIWLELLDANPATLPPCDLAPYLKACHMSGQSTYHRYTSNLSS